MLSSLPVPDLLVGASPVLSREEASHIAVLRDGSRVKGVSGGVVSLGATAPTVRDDSDETGAAGGSAPTPLDTDDGEPYYWENATPGEINATPSLPVVLVHHVHYFFSRAWSTAEYLGDFFSEMFGLYNSRYEWAVELERRHIEEAEEAELLEERKKRWAELKVAGVKPTLVQQPAGVPVKVRDPEAGGLLSEDADAEGGGAEGMAGGV